MTYSYAKDIPIASCQDQLVAKVKGQKAINTDKCMESSVSIQVRLCCKSFFFFSCFLGGRVGYHWVLQPSLRLFKILKCEVWLTGDVLTM